MSAAETQPVRLWLDDVRRPPDDEWRWVKSVEDATKALASGTVAEVSLDHDLHPYEHDGLEVVEWMAAHQVWPRLVRVHTANQTASTKICNLLEQHGYRPIPGRPRTFTRPGGADGSASEFARASHRNSPNAMRKLS